VASLGFVFEWLRIIGKAGSRALALLLGFRRSPGASRGAPCAEVGGHDCEGKDHGLSSAKTSVLVESLLPEVFVKPSEGNGRVRKKMDNLPHLKLIGRVPGDSPLGMSGVDAVIRYARELILADLPNDLNKLVYLASLRDCNTGHYFHPQISQQNDSISASQALRLCHEEIFARLIATPLSEYVTQLGGYICYTHADEARVIDTWKSLPAYRATVPLKASVLDAEFFFASVEAALIVLDTRRVGNL
jgi:hypothetical protein